jgi:hypothetical protein
MFSSDIYQLLIEVKEGKVSAKEALERLRFLPYKELGVASVDHHRALRQGFSEVILAEGKTQEQILEIAKEIIKSGVNLLVTRCDKEKGEYLSEKLKGVRYDPISRTLVLKQQKPKTLAKEPVLILTAGTSDISVAEEARITLEVLGCKVECLYDVGVAGVHRLTTKLRLLNESSVIIVIAGMEGALASVVGGLVTKPVIAVPTSRGYGTSFGGLSALLTMLNSCAAGVTVVNIDNGFGAAYAAFRIIQTLT